jgi:ADP-ribose pyrophosphatase YjhB (NUDIX family)
MSKAPNSITFFQVVVVVVIFAIDTEGQRLLVLLIRRRRDPGRGLWSLPDTGIEGGESLREAALGVVHNHLRVGHLYLEQLYTFAGCAGWDPGTLAISYLALVPYEECQLLAEDVEGIAWFGMPELPALAGDHNTICQYAHQRLGNKLEYSPIAFDLLPPAFTLSQVYQLYETVMGRHFADYSNFRSRLLKLGFLKATGEKTTQGVGRPAALYRFDHQRFERVKNKPLLFI